MIKIALLHLLILQFAYSNTTRDWTTTTTRGYSTTTTRGYSTTTTRGYPTTTTGGYPTTTTGADATTTTSEDRCPVGWVESTEGCFLFHHTATGLTWRQGQEECEKLGGYLAEIKTEMEQAFLMSIANLEEILIDTKSWQIGLSDQGHEGRWMWQHSADNVDFEAWAWNQPDGTDSGNDCACMDQESGYQWVAKRCDDPVESGSPICQRYVYDTTSTTTSSPSPAPSTRIELIGGDGYRYGNVYATNSNGYFGPVCDDDWGSNEANVVCRQLGFSSGTYHTGSYYVTPSTSKFAMDDVVCSGSEKNLQDCKYNLNDNCGVDECAGVHCN